MTARGSCGKCSGDPPIGRWPGVKWNYVSWLKSNRSLLVAQVIAVPLVVAWLWFAYVHGHATAAFVMILLIPVFAVANLVIINRARGHLSDPKRRRDSLTGVTISPSLLLPQSTTASPHRWVGAADLPGAMGRMNASVPLGVLDLSGDRLTLRVRPRFLASMFGAHPLSVAPPDVESIFPARARLRYPAIGIRPRDEPPSYFLLGGDRSSMLTAIAAAGFPVEWSERTYSVS